MKSDRPNFRERGKSLRIFRLIDAFLISLVLCGMTWAADRTVRISPRSLPASKQNLVLSLIDKTDTPDAVIGRLQQASYYDAMAEIVDDTMIVTPGAQYVFGDISVNVVRQDGRVIKRSESGWNGVTATAAEIEAAKISLLRKYQDAGHYFSSIQTESVRLESGRIDFQFRIIVGPAVHIERVRFRGLKKSRPDFMTSLTGLHKGMPLTSDVLRTAVKRLRAQDYLRVDSTPRITPDQTYENAELLFFVEEGPRNIIELGGGYVPAQAGQDGQFIGKIDYRIRNLFGSGRRINFLYDKRNRRFSTLNFTYSQPVFIPQYLELIASVNQTDYDSLYHSFSAAAGFDLLSGDNTRFSSRFSWTKTEPEFTSQDATRLIRGSFGFMISSFADTFNPASGTLISGDIAYLRRIAWPDSLSVAIINNESAFNLQFMSVIGIYRQLQFGFHADARVLLTSRDIVPYSEQFKLGGYGSLRGYRQDQFAGRRVAFIQHELLYRPSERAAVYVFGDAGYVYSRKRRPDETLATDDLIRFGSGAGLRFGSRTARLTFEIGWGRGDTAGDGKVHVGLQTAF